MSDRNTPAKRLPRRPALALLAAFALLAALFHTANPLTRAARDYAGTVAASSAAIYVTLRSLNAVLSVAQEIEVGGSLVVSGTVQPLKVLEPIDDTIERIAGLVFFVMVATGVLAVALGPVGGVGWAMVALACVLAALPGRWQRPVLGRRLGVYGAVLGLAVPLAFVLTGAMADRMTHTVWLENKAVIDEITGHVQPDAAIPEDSGWFSLIPDDLAHYQVVAGRLVTRADDLIASYIAVLSVFVFKLLVLPALLLGGLYLGLSALVRPRV